MITSSAFKALGFMMRPSEDFKFKNIMLRFSSSWIYGLWLTWTC